MHGVHTLLLLALSALLTLTSAGCAPPEQGEEQPHRPRSSVPVSRPHVTDAFPEGRAQSAVEFWHHNPDLVPQVLDASTLLLDAAGTGASSITVPEGQAQGSLVLVLTCERPVAYSISLVAEETAEALTSTGGDSCGGPAITLFTTPPLNLATTTAEIEVEVPDDTAYYLAVYRTARGTIPPTDDPRLARSPHDSVGTAPR
ncbi:hypothetical protein [Sanguibacter sp. 25GB23B1]|uniref:hypothetical protein n=1 Tax=unclassified Sanguibacter TaxID=2645534 RepID=UPI0032AF008F